MKIKNYFLGLFVINLFGPLLHAMKKQENNDAFQFDLYDNLPKTLPTTLSFLDEDTESESTINKPNSFLFDQSEQAAKIQKIDSEQLFREYLIFQAKIALFIVERCPEKYLPARKNVHQDKKATYWCEALFNILNNLEPNIPVTTNAPFAMNINAFETISIFFSREVGLSYLYKKQESEKYYANPYHKYWSHIAQNNNRAITKLNICPKNKININLYCDALRNLHNEEKEDTTVLSYEEIKKKYQLYDILSIIPDNETKAEHNLPKSFVIR